VPTFESATIAYTHSDDPDFAGAIIWLSQTASSLDAVMAEDAHQVYKGPDSAVLLPGLMFNSDYYFRIAAYDAFGPTELVPTATLHFKTTNLNVDAIADGVLGDSKLIPELQSRIDLIDADKFVAGSVNARIETLRTSVFDDPVSGLPAALAQIVAINDISSTSSSANAANLYQLKAQVNDAVTGLPAAQTSIAQLNNISATSTSAAAQSIYQLNSRLNNIGGVTLEQKFTTQANVNTGLLGQYTVKIDNNGYVAGFGLSSDTSLAGVNTSEFTINADKFGVIMPSYPGVHPFTIGTVGGTPRVILSNALIGDASISTAMIGDAQINTLKLAGEAVTVPVASYAPDKKTVGNGVSNYVVINEAYINLPEAGMLYMLATGAQTFPGNGGRQWRFKIRLNGVDAQQVQGNLANDCPVVSVSKPAVAGVNHVEVLWAGENSGVYFGYSELFVMGVKK
jgi:hypothetical protein